MTKLKLITWFFVLAATASPAFAETQALYGHVRDVRTHAGLPFVKIELLEQGVRVGLEYSDNDGRFAFGNIQTRSYSILATLAGYNTVTIEVDTMTQSLVELELTRSGPPIQQGSPVMSLRDYVPEGARKEFDRARKDIERQDCGKAIEHLEKGLRLSSQNALALNDLGNCRRKLGDLQGAETAFKQAMALSDGGYIAANLAETFSAQKRFGEAETVLKDAIRKTPEDGAAYYALGVTYFMQGRLADAEVVALQADSRNHIPDLHLLLAKIYLKRNSDKAAPQLEFYLKEAPNSPQSKQIRESLKATR